MILSSSAVPARPDAPAGGAVRPARRWLPTALVASVMSVTVLGGFVVAETLPAPEVRPVALGGVLTLRPLPGWEVVRRDQITVPSPSGGVLQGEFAQLTRGSGALDLLALPGAGGRALELAELYAGEVLAGQLDRLAISDRVEGIVLPSGLEAVRFGYIGSAPQTGAAVEGSVTVVVAPSGNGAVFDGWAFQGQLELIGEELVVMIERAKVA
jgi:hypothetical protein